MEKPIISEQDMVKEKEAFYAIFETFIGEIELMERTRGKLSEFQLIQAIYHAKDTVGILGWDRRQTINSIFEKYMYIYLAYGREEADEWVEITFGFRIERAMEVEPEALSESQGQVHLEPEPSYFNEEPKTSYNPLELRVKELSLRIMEKESELLQLYREFYSLQQGN
ncbi:hypothetical protein [Paenibacillus silvisoli]|uniref:hypothetical protein n=1 Tax=Paenibacillus silvisoli TaxID=3110539 RepID=UPI002803C106|nr:hypothetical protein [Paenibacillus silvisoli]